MDKIDPTQKVSDMIGKTLSVNNEKFTIVGIDDSDIDDVEIYLSNDKSLILPNMCLFMLMYFGETEHEKNDYILNLIIV